MDLDKYLHIRGCRIIPKTAEEMYEEFLQDFAEGYQQLALNSTSSKERRRYHYFSVAAFSIVRHEPFKNGNQKYELDATYAMMNAMISKRQELKDVGSNILNKANAGHVNRVLYRKIVVQFDRMIYAFDKSISELETEVNRLKEIGEINEK